MPNAALLDRTKEDAGIALAQSLAAARGRHGKSFASQISEIVRLGRGVGRLSPQEYFYFRLYDDSAYTSAARSRFLGRKVQHGMIAACCDQRWWATAHDKLLYNALMQAHGLPVPRTQAVFHPSRSLPGAAALRTPDELREFLLGAVRYPLFGKPCEGMWSVGAVSLEALDGPSARVTAAFGRALPVDQVVAEIAAYRDEGYLFQDCLRPHPGVVAMIGERVATVRLILMQGERGPEPYKALWKIPTGENVADNFWRRGNLLAALDVERGVIQRVVQGVGAEQTTHEHHPETGARLVGEAVPDWAALRDTCLAAAALFPGLKLQTWDVAPTADGPVLVELNVGGDFNLPQIAFAEGLLDDRFRDLLRRSGYRLKG